MCTRSKFLYWPATEAQRAKTFLLDWNVTTRIVSLYNGARFEQDAVLRGRLLDLAKRFPDGGKVLPGFSAAEPEIRPQDCSGVLERAENRTGIAIAMLEQGSHHFDAFLDGTLEPSRTITLAEDPVKLDGITLAKYREAFIQPGFAVLLKAVLLRAQVPDVSKRISDYKFWLNHELKYRPSRELLVGLLILAGSPRGLAMAQDILKLGKTRTAAERAKDVWGAAWDLHYSRLVSFSRSDNAFARLPRPFAFVTDDQRLYDVIKEFEMVGTVRPQGKSDFGLDYFPIESFISTKFYPQVVSAIYDMQQRMETAHNSLNKNKNAVATKARYLARGLTRELEQCPDALAALV